MKYLYWDYAIGIGAGALVAGAAAFAVPGNIHPLVSMLLGGMLGMVVQSFLSIVLLPIFGAFEVMIPLHIIGMLAGMLGGMAATIPNTPVHCILSAGGATGFGVALIVYLSNRKLTRAA